MPNNAHRSYSPFYGTSLEPREQYTGKEYLSAAGLNWQDLRDNGVKGPRCRARWYDPAVARWWVVDPLASEMPSYSPYNYVMNNPLGSIDPDGRKPANIIITLRDEHGKPRLEIDYKQDGSAVYKSGPNKGKAYEAGSNAFFDMTLAALAEARASDSRIDKMFSDLEDAKSTHEFTNDEVTIKDNGSKTIPFGGPGSRNTRTQFKPRCDAKNAGNDPTITPASVAIHEGKHAVDRARNARPVGNAPSGIPNKEIHAINTANIYRNVKGLRLKTGFNGVDITDDFSDPKTFDPNN